MIYMEIRELVILFDLYGRDQGDAPAGTFQIGDTPVMQPGSRSTTIDGQDVNTIWEEANARLAAFNRVTDAATAFMSFPVATTTEKVGVPRNPGFQQATEFGRPTKIRVETVTRAYPLTHFDLGYGYSREYLDYATSTQIMAVEAEVRNAWASLRRNKVLEAIFTAANGSQEALSIKRLYNNDGEVPPKFKRWTHSGTHQHYLTSNAASLAAGDLNTMEEELIHHGFGEFGEQLILMVHRDEMDDVRGFTNFVPAETSTVPRIINTARIGAQPGFSGQGLVAQGHHNRLTVVENNDIPSGYLMCFATGGTFASRNIVGLRVHENPSARGLRLVEGPNGRYPLIDAVYDGYVGAGVRQRGAATVMQVTTGSYTTPTFESP
jgi:hypothetical protein